MKALLALKYVWVVSALCGVCVAAPVHLRVDSRVNPLGIDEATPRFSWQSDSLERNWKQSAYELQVANSAAKLAAGNADIWDSGKIASDESVDVAYGGPALTSETHYVWRVKVWDAKGASLVSGEPASFEMGLLRTADWKAQWIEHTDAAEQAALASVNTIWLPGTDAAKVPGGTVAEFSYKLQLAARPELATLHVLNTDKFTVTVNGVETGHKSEWSSFDMENVREALKWGVGAAGENTIVVHVEVPKAWQAGQVFHGELAVALRLRKTGDTDDWIVSGKDWMARAGTTGEWSPAQQLGKLKVIQNKRDGDPQVMASPDRIVSGTSLLRKEFASHGKPVAARLYITALGSYEAFLNGRKVGADQLTPGFTDFRKRVEYQTYDVTAMVTAGTNTLAAMLGAGWHGSPLLWSGVRRFTGPDALRAQLELTYADGTHETVASDASWMTSNSPVISSEIYGGENYDARAMQPGWNANGFVGGKRWTPATTIGVDADVAVTAQPDEPIRAHQTIKPVSMKLLTIAGKKVAVFDMGQNMVGVVKLMVHGARGTTVRMRFAERINADGSIYTENLRDADATDYYTLRGGGAESWEPAFTFHGFRYVELEGYPGMPTPSAIEGQVWNSLSGGPTMTLTTSSTLLNKMDELGLWGQRGNFVSVPTDCPQRDERMGWMGDAGAFWRTGSYNFDIAAFTSKFMRDVTDAQTPTGAFTNISPDLLQGHDSIGAPGWGDAGVLVPYATWLQYGDRSLVEANWAAMQKWMAFVEHANPNHLRQKELGPNYADWLAPDPNTPRDLVATAYWALIAQEMATMATALGRNEDAKKYEATFAQVREAFQHEYIAPDGMMRGDTQTDYAVALAMDLAPKEVEQSMTDRLVKNIADHGNHLTTGFLGTPYLLPALDKEGRDDVAYGLLMSDTYPSWGYMVAKGATTWWERWNGDTGDSRMNSYNHYAFGSVMAWVYRKTAGIDADPMDAGYHHVLVHPIFTAKLSHVQAKYDSVYGPVKTEWSRVDGGALRLMVTVPANATATVRLPASAGSKVTLDGRAATGAFHDGAVWQNVGAGTYSFTVAP